MATSQIASMLDELMGRNRNVAPNENVREIQWFDPEVCRFFMVQFCPHDLFTNTKADLGPCAKLHDEELKRKFSEEPPDNYRKTQYVEDFLRFCQRMLTELQSRIKKAKERLSLTQQQQNGASSSLQFKEIKDKIELLSEKINKCVEEAETAGIAGNVEEAQGLLKLCDQFREERDELRNSLNAEFVGSHQTQQKAMEVCDVCGAFLIVGDAQQRIDDHLLGKQHVGYARLRAATDKIAEERQKWREEREQEAEERRKKREEERSSRRSKREDERSSSRRRRRSPSKERGRHERRRRSRSRRRRSRSRDKSRRSKDRRRSSSRKRKSSDDGRESPSHSRREKIN